MAAARYGHVEAVKALLASGADATITDKHGHDAIAHLKVGMAKNLAAAKNGKAVKRILTAAAEQPQLQATIEGILRENFELELKRREEAIMVRVHAWANAIQCKLSALQSENDVLKSELRSVVSRKRKRVDEQSRTVKTQPFARLSSMLESEKGHTRRLKGEVETKAKLLEDAKSKLEDFEEYFYNPVLTEQVRLKREVVDAKDELIKAEDCGVNIKEAGSLNRGMFWGKIKAKNLEAFRACEMLLEDSDFRPLRCGRRGEMEPDPHHPKLDALRAVYGDEPARIALEAWYELEKYNPSGGYQVKIPWHASEDRELTLAEGIRDIVAFCRKQSRKRRATKDIEFWKK